MNTIQNLNKKFSSPIVFVVCVTFIILFGFLFLVPKLASDLFPQKREMLLRNFLTRVKKEHHINPQTYWKFREFYSPGYFTFSRTGIPINLENPILFQSKVTIDDIHVLPFLRFSSPLLNSIDYLTSKSILSHTNSILVKPNALYEDSNSLIYQLDKKHIVIVFLLPLSEMKKANGFFEYTDRDKLLVKGKLWLNVTVVTEE